MKEVHHEQRIVDHRYLSSLRLMSKTLDTKHQEYQKQQKFEKLSLSFLITNSHRTSQNNLISTQQVQELGYVSLHRYFSLEKNYQRSVTSQTDEPNPDLISTTFYRKEIHTNTIPLSQRNIEMTEVHHKIQLLHSNHLDHLT